jgi:hypothetical protein
MKINGKNGEYKILLGRHHKVQKELNELKEQYWITFINVQAICENTHALLWLELR